MKFEQLIIKEIVNNKPVEKEVRYRIDGEEVEKNKFYNTITNNFMEGFEIVSQSSYGGTTVSENGIETTSVDFCMEKY